MRRAVRRVGLPAVALLSAACSGSPSTSPPPASAPSAQGTIAPPTTVLPTPADRFEIQGFEVAAADGAPESFQPVRTQVAEALDRYLDKAVLSPLRSGQPAGDLSALFAGTAVERVAGPDRAALVDEGLPPVIGVAVERATALVAVLAGPGAEAGFASARISMLVTGIVGAAPLTVERTGELILGRDGDTWKITGYEIRVSTYTHEASASTGA